MATAPNCSKNAVNARLRRASHIEQNKEDAQWAKTLKKANYPKCTEFREKVFDSCPGKVEDIDNPPSGCRSCPGFSPTRNMIKRRAEELMLLRKSLEKK